MKTLFKFLTVIFALILIISTQNAIAQFTCGTDSVQDVDGNWYNTILIGSQCWFKENLRTTKYPDNTAITKGPISQATTSWVSDQAFYSCPPNAANNGEDCTASGSLGLLYQWSAAMDGVTTEGAQGVCPTGWHVPSDAEWKILEGSLGMSVLNQNSTGYRGTDEGSQMANDISGQSWNAGNLRSNAAFGSSGLDIGTTGYRHSSGDYYYRGLNTIMWTSTEAGTKAYMRYLYHIYSNINRFPYAKALGACVRCVQDSVSSTASAGIYTIGKNGTQDYSSFNAAVNDLPSLVLNGPVVFNVDTGTYTEKVDLSNINGTASNTITFQSASGDSTDVILQDSSTGSTWTESFTLRLSNSDYFRFKKMTIKNTSTGPNGKVVDITGGSDHNELSNCVFQGHPTSTSAAHANIYSQGAINDNYNIIKNNHIIGGSYGISMFGAGPPTYEIGNQILNNVFDNQNYCGFKCYYLDAYTFEGNEINMSPTQSKGIESYYTKNSVKILNNKISGSYGYGVYFSRHNSDSPYTDSALIANNFISMSGNGVIGVDCDFSIQTKWYYNSINISGSDTNTYGFKLTGNVAGYPGHIIRNNIISNKAGGFAFYTSSANSTFDSDYNDLYTTGTNLGFTAVNWVWVMIPNLAAWRTATGGDANSISSLPGFVSTTDLHLTTQLSSNGTPLTDITTDIDGELRSATTPDIGADEYSASYSSSLDAGIISIATSSVCEGNQNISVELKNFGQTTLNSAQIAWKSNNINQTPYTWNGNLISGDTITIIIASGFHTAALTSYYLEAYPILINSVADVNPVNDTAKLINQMYYSLPTINITTVSPLCENSNNVSLAASPSGGIFSGQGVSNNSFNPNNAGVGNHTVLYALTDSNGCFNTDSMIIKVNAKPIANAGTDLSTYPGGSVNLNGSATGGSGFYSYSWLPPNLVANSTNASTSTTALSTSGYFTLYVIDDSTSCSNTDDIYITISGSSLSISASSDKSAVCVGGNVVLNSSAIGGSNNYTYLWTSVPAGLNSTLSSLTVNPIVSTYYFVTLNDGSTTLTDSVFVSVYSNPSVSISGINSTYCSQDFGSVVSVNPSGGTLNGNGIGGNYFYPTTAGLGTHIITYSYIDGNGCSGSDSISTTVNLNPTVSITSILSPSYCVDANSINLSASPSGGVYSGSGISASLFNPSQANIGNNQITYSYTDGNGCSGSDMISTIVNSLPTVSITTTLSPSYCINSNSVNLSASPSGGVYSGPGISASLFNPSQANIGFNQIVYSFTDVNSCTGSDTVNTTVVINPTVNISTTLSSSYCQNEAGITLTASPGGGTFSGSITSAYFDPSQVQAGQQNIIYSYTDGNGCTASDSISTIVNSIPTVSITSSISSSYCIDEDSVNLSASPSGGTFSGPGITGSSFYPSQANIGNNQIMYSSTDGNGCTGSDIIYTIVNPLPTVVFTASLDSNYCEDASPINLSAYPLGGVYNGPGVSAASFNPSLANIGANQLIYSFTDINSCSNSDTISTNVSALPIVSFGTLSDICSDVQQITLSGGTPTGGIYNGIAVNSSQ
ncbi:pectinesterase family protein, partial [Bacteroidota bacterium]